MSKINNNQIADLDTDWGNDGSGVPYSGASVQSFIKKYLRKAENASNEIASVVNLVNKKAGAFYVEPDTGLFVIFRDEESKNSYIADGDESGVIGKFALGGAESETVYMMTVNTPKDTYSFTSSSEKMEITSGFTSRVKYTDDEGYIEFKESALFSVSVIKSGSESVVVSSGNIVKNGGTFTFDVKPYVGNGDNTVIITAEGLVSASRGVTAVTVGVTSMALLPMDFKWNVPFVEGKSYALGGLKVLGTLDKKLHINISGNGYNKKYEVPIGTAQYDDVAYNFDGMEHPSETGVYKVEIWIEAVDSGITTEVLSYNIMCVSAEDTATAQLICMNDVTTEALNYSESKLFSYAVYNGGASTATPSFTIQKDADIITDSEQTASTSVIHEYSYSFMLPFPEDATQINVLAKFGNEQTAIITLKNDATLAPVAGYSFYMDAATRTNGDDSREYFINEVNQEGVPATWKDMAWVNGMDGWTTDDNGNKCLLIPALSNTVVDITPMKNVSTVTIEMLYKVSNVSDFSEDIITILKDTTESWMGMKIKPTNITLHSQSLFSEDVKQGYNTRDEEIVHLVVTIVSNYAGIGNVAMIYVNGVKKCSFEWANGDTFANDGALKLGSTTADLYLYKMRVYGFAFSWQQARQNYIASIMDMVQKTNIKKKEDSVLNDANEIDYDKVYGVYNTMVVELPKGASLPNRKNNPSNDAIKGTNLYINIIQDPTCSIQGDWLNIPLEGQGTTAMTYYRWNLRSKTSDEYGKFRITAKKNVASSMHSHKRGATALYNDLNLAIVGANEANGRVAVYQYPVYGFQKIEHEDKPGTYYYQFIGLYTVGPDKGDKSTFGYNNKTYKNTLIHMEGTDHSPRGVGMEYPWEQMVVGLNEDGDAFIGSKNADGSMNEGAWGIGVCGDKEEVADMKAYLDVEFAPAYILDYECTPMIAGLPSGTSINDVNADIKNFRSQVADNGFTYADCHIYIDGEYDLYYFNINSQTYVKDGRKIYQGLTEYGFSESELASKATTLDKTEYIRQYRRARHKAEVGNYWLLDDSLFHACFVDLIGATDNEKKNSYPYKFGTLASGSRWRWRQDDLDTIFDVNNQGGADKKYSIMNTDSHNGDMIYKGNTSYHWRCIREYYKDEYKAMMKRIMAKMVELCPVGYGSSQIQKLVGCIRHYFWDYAQEYFTGGAYNIDAKWTYEDTWAIYQSDKSVNAVHPLQQSLGSHYEAEVAWVTLRMLFLASMNEFGAFVDYVDSSEGQVSFRQGGDFTFSLTPAIDMRPAVIQGKNSKKIHAEGRVMAGDSVDISMPTDTSADTMVYIQGADWMSDIGDFSKVQIGSSDKTFSVSSKRAQRIKVGDVNADEVTTNIGKLDVGYCPSVVEVEARNVTSLSGNVDLSKLPRLRRAYFGNTNATAITLPDGSKVQEYDLPSSLIRLSLRKLPLLEDTKYKLYTAELEYTGRYYTTNQGVGNKCTYAVTTDAAVAGGLVINLNGVKSITVTGKGGNSPRLWCFVAANDIILSCAEGQASATDLTLTIPTKAAKCIVQFMASASYKVVIEEGQQGGLTYTTLNNLSYLWVEDNAKVEGYDLMKSALSGGSPLTNIRVIGFDKTGDKTDVDTLKTLANGNYHGIDADGNNDNTSYPIIEGSLHITGSASGKDRDFFKVAFPNLVFSSDKFVDFIEFADPEVLRVLLANGVDTDDDGGITEEEAAAVTSIGTWFKGNTAIETFDEFGVFINAQAIPANAFNGDTALKSIDLSKVTSLGSSAFYNCTSLEFDDLQLTNLTSLGKDAFYGVKIKKISNLGKITALPAATSSTQNFGDKSVLEELVLPPTITSLSAPYLGNYTNCVIKGLNLPLCTSMNGYNGFSGCKLEGDINLPALEGQIGSNHTGNGYFQGTNITSVSSLGNATSLQTGYNTNGAGTFAKCKSLKTVNLPLTMKKIGKYSFYQCSSLDTINIEHIEKIDAYSFADCKSLHIDASRLSNIVSIGKTAFYNIDVYGTLHAENLTTLGGLDYEWGGFQSTNIERITSLGQITSIPNGYNSDYGWFKNCKNLKIVILPETITSIGSYAFNGCTSMESVVVLTATPASIGTGCFSNTNSCPIYVPDESVTAYREASGWSTYADRIRPMSEYGVVREYENITSNYTLEKGQAYGQEGGSIQFTTDAIYEHTKASISDVSFVMVKAPSQASSLVQYVNENDTILKIAITNYPSTMTRYYIENIEGATHIYVTSATGTMELWKEVIE